jgi:predicted porin
MGLYGKGKVKVDIYTYLRRKRKAGVSDRGARVGLKGQPTPLDGEPAQRRQKRGFH